MQPSFFERIKKESEVVELDGKTPFLYYNGSEPCDVVCSFITGKMELPMFKIQRVAKYPQWHLVAGDLIIEHIESLLQNIVKHAAFMGTTTMGDPQSKNGFTNHLIDTMNSVLLFHKANKITDILTETKIDDKSDYDVCIHDNLAWLRHGWWYGQEHRLAIGIDNSHNPIKLVTKGIELETLNSGDVVASLSCGIALTNINKVIMGVY